MSLINLSAAQLRRAANLQEKIEALTVELNKTFGIAPSGRSSRRGSPRKMSSGSKPVFRRRSRRMSAALKARLSAIAKARWKKVKASGKNAL
jgi:hypothetical protein